VHRRLAQALAPLDRYMAPVAGSAAGELSQLFFNTGANRSENVAALLSRAAASDDEIRV